MMMILIVMVDNTYVEDIENNKDIEDILPFDHQ
jgi:hypothetical protein